MVGVKFIAIFYILTHKLTKKKKKKQILVLYNSYEFMNTCYEPHEYTLHDSQLILT